MNPGLLKSFKKPSRYKNLFSTRFLAPMDCSKIPAMYSISLRNSKRTEMEFPPEAVRHEREISNAGR